MEVGRRRQPSTFTFHLSVPSYPYSEDCTQGEQYMNTRCPAWCDRILMSPSAKDLVLRVSERHRDPGEEGRAWALGCGTLAPSKSSWTQC